MTFHSEHSPSNRAPSRAQLDNSLSGPGDASLRAFYSCPPLAETGPGAGAAFQPSRGQVLRTWIGTTLFWLTEILGAASLFIVLIAGLIFGEILR